MLHSNHHFLHSRRYNRQRRYTRPPKAPVVDLVDADADAGEDATALVRRAQGIGQPRWLQKGAVNLK